jgi:hypothetical protein
MTNKPWKRGDPMPKTIKQFEYMGDLYEAGYLKMEETIATQKTRINKLDQRIGKIHKQCAGTPVPVCVSGMPPIALENWIKNRATANPTSM